MRQSRQKAGSLPLGRNGNTAVTSISRSLVTLLPKRFKRRTWQSPPQYDSRKVSSRQPTKTQWGGSPYERLLGYCNRKADTVTSQETVSNHVLVVGKSVATSNQNEGRQVTVLTAQFRSFCLSPLVQCSPNGAREVHTCDLLFLDIYVSIYVDQAQDHTSRSTRSSVC
jgi:hypothetical protein